MTTPPFRRREIESYWQKLPRVVQTVIAGDFNEDATGSALAFLRKQSLSRVATTGPATWHYQVHSPSGTSDVLKMDIDHVMICDKLAASAAQVIDAGASDHRPVIVTLTAGRRLLRSTARCGSSSPMSWNGSANAA